MTPDQEQEIVEALKSIAASLEQLNRYVTVITQQKLGIAPPIVARLTKSRPQR